MVTETKNDFDRLMSRVDSAEERTSDLEGITTETAKLKAKQKKL